jgi:hypothetical protein
MSDQARRQQGSPQAGGTPDEPHHRELEPLLWQAHVNEEMERMARERIPAPGVHHFAQEYAERAMRGVEAVANEYQRAAERGEEHGAGDVAGYGYVADAGDIAGG